MTNMLQPFESEESLWPFHHNWPIMKGLLQSSNDISIWEDKDAVVVETALPGVSKENVELIYEKGVLTVRGEKKEEKQDKDRKYYQKSSSSFVYRLSVPGEIDDSVEPEAKLNNGVLQIRFKKHLRSQPRKINVQ